MTDNKLFTGYSRRRSRREPLVEQFKEEEWDVDVELDKIYNCSSSVRCAGFHLIHKLILLYIDPGNKEKCMEKIKEIIKDDPELVNSRLENEWTPLILCLMNSPKHDFMPIIKFLINHQGCDVDLADINDKTPLHIITRFSQRILGQSRQIMNLLIEKGCDLDPKDDMGRTPLMHACRYANTDSNVWVVERLINAGCTINTQDDDGWTALMLAVRWVKTESTMGAVKLMVENGCDLNKINNDGDTALMVGMLSTNEVMDYLIEKGADLNIRDKDGDTFLHKAMRKMSDRLVQTTIRKPECDVIIVNNDGISPFDIALKSSNWPILRELCVKVDNINTLSAKGVPSDIMDRITEELEPIKKPKVVERKIIRNRGRKLNEPIQRTVIVKVVKEEVEKEDKFNGELDCVVCLDGPKSVCIDPCHHISVCRECIKGLKECPVCRGPIERSYNIFL